MTAVKFCGVPRMGRGARRCGGRGSAAASRAPSPRRVTAEEAAGRIEARPAQSATGRFAAASPPAGRSKR